MSDPKSEIFFAAVETTRMPMIVTDPRQPDNPIIFANRAFLAMTGYSPEELIGRNCRFLQGPETDRETVSQVRQAIAERREFATEILNYRKNGSTFWNALFVSPVHNTAGELVYYFASQLDVSRRRDAEEALGQAQKMEALGQLTGASPTTSTTCFRSSSAMSTSSRRAWRSRTRTGRGSGAPPTTSARRLSAPQR